MGRWIAGCVVAGLVMAGSGCSSAAHFRAHRDGPSLYAVMHDSVREGDSLAKVERLLGRGLEDGQKEALKVSKGFAAKDPAKWPDGVNDDDWMVGFRFGELSTLWLQFRDGKLVNHNPADYAKCEPMVNSVSG